jgi:hypothetical protein
VSVTPTAATPQGTPAPAAVDVPGRCYRCGRPTRSPDVGLCDTCNPSGIAGPTATQVHGLILASVAGALIVLALAAKLFASNGGPFPAVVTGQAAHADGTIEVVVRITNEGSTSARPTCTIVRGPQDTGVEFLAERIEPGATVETTKRVPALPPAATNALAEVSCR